MGDVGKTLAGTWVRIGGSGQKCSKHIDAQFLPDGSFRASHIREDSTWVDTIKTQSHVGALPPQGGGIGRFRTRGEVAPDHASYFVSGVGIPSGEGGTSYALDPTGDRMTFHEVSKAWFLVMAANADFICDYAREVPAKDQN